MKHLEKSDFPGFVLLIEKGQTENTYKGELIFTAPILLFDEYHGVISDGILLNYCTFQHERRDGHFTIQAYPRTRNLIIAAAYVIPTTLLWLTSMLYLYIENKSSFENIFGITAIAIIIFLIFINIYRRDAKFLNKVGSLATEIENSKSAE
jgi:hypothetical protein